MRLRTFGVRLLGRSSVEESEMNKYVRTMLRREIKGRNYFCGKNETPLRTHVCFCLGLYSQLSPKGKEISMDKKKSHHKF